MSGFVRTWTPEQLQTKVAAERRAQGLPAVIEEPSVLRRLAGLFNGLGVELSPSAMPAQPPRAAVDGECPTARSAGRGTVVTTAHVVADNAPGRQGDDVVLAVGSARRRRAS